MFFYPSHAVWEDEQKEERENEKKNRVNTDVFHAHTNYI
jgi:hypothetical protein